jgi:type II secretory pathway component PulJ
VALLEVMVAVAILASAAVSIVALLAQSADHERRAAAFEAQIADEERLLTAVALLTRSDLDRRLGRRTAGPYEVEIQRPRPELYRVTIGLRDEAADLATLLYRPERAQ